jgi:hypothetical protein
MAFRAGDRTVFVYGFAKNERDNIGSAELEFWRRVAGAFVAMDDVRLQTLLDEQEIMEVAGALKLLLLARVNGLDAIA